MTRVQAEYRGGGQQTQAVAPQMVQAIRAPMDTNAGTGAAQLVQALGFAHEGLDKFGADYERRKTQEQEGKLAWYTEQFQKDHEGGAVSAAQVKDRFPETVPIIAARIAESVGRKAAEPHIESVIQEIQGNDDIRLNTENRNAFIKQKRAELLGKMGQGNDFYAAGYVAMLDRKLGEYDNQWAGQTAEYHQKLQSEDFSKEVRTILNGGAGTLDDLNARYKHSSSLNDIERQHLVVSTATDVAFASDDPSMLDKVPAKFLTPDAQQKLVQTKIQIQNQRMSNFRNNQMMVEYQRTEGLRKAKTQMIATVSGGGQVNPADYRNDPEQFAFALSLRDFAPVSEVASTGTMQTMRDQILTAASAGTGGDLGGIVDSIQRHPGMNPKQKQTLIEEAPKLLEGAMAMQDPSVRTTFSDRIGPRLTSLESSTNASIQTLITGRNLRGEAVTIFDKGIRASFDAEYQDTGKWPTGRRKLELIDAVTERTEKYLEQATKITKDTAAPAPAAPAAAPAKPAAAPKAAPAAAAPAAPAAAGKKRVEVLPGVFKLQ